MKKQQKQSINTGTEANKVDKVLNSHLTRIGLSDEDFLMNFTFSESKERPDLAIKDKDGNFCIVFENKKDFKGLSGAKNQGLKYLKQLKDINSLSNKVLLVATNMTTFHANEYEVVNGEITWIKEINSIDSIDDITLKFIKNYTHPQKQEEEKLLSTDKLELKRMFDKINNDLRELSGLNIQDRLEITMAMLFLKLLKENNDFISEIDNYKQEKQDLIDELNILRNSVSEKTIINTFDAINRLYKEHFYFDIPKYKGKNFLLDLYNIIDTFHLSNYDLDIKGEAFEYFINYGNTKSNDMGQYFTPRHIVKFMINLVDLEFENSREKWFGKKYFDPTCGTGGFLIEIFKKVRTELIKAGDLTDDNKKILKQDSVFGNERTEQTCKIARMNMILTGDGHSNINNGDFLLIKDDVYRKGFFDVSIGNPPFGNNREWEFIDGFLKDIKNKGYSIILVPEGVLFKADKNFVEIRRTLLNKGKLLKVISLPQGIFLPYAGVKTNIIFWKNEIQDKDYDIEFIDIKNDGFSLDANRRQLQNSDLEEYFENKQSLIDKGQIWNVNSGKIYDKTKLNELELSKSKLEIEEKNQKNKIETLKKQLKQIDDKTEKEQKEKRILELQSSFDELKKQIKKVNDKLKTFDINLVVNRYKIQKEINKNIEYALFGDLVEYLPKSKRNASDGQKTGKYPFFTSSEIQDKYIDEADYIEECLIMGTGGKACIHISEEFSTSTDNFIISTIKEKLITKYLYYLLKYNIHILEAGFKGAGLKHISKEYINNIQIPLISLEYQQEIIKQIEKYEKVINGAKQVIDNLDLEIEINKNWEIVELGDYIDMISGYAFESKDFVDNGIQVVKIGNVKDGFFDKENNPSYLPINFKEKFGTFLLKKDDIIISMTGTVGKTDYGNVCLVDEGEYLLNQRVGKIQAVGNKLIPKFLYYISFSSKFKEQLFTFSTGGIRQANISNTQIKQIKIPLPPLEEQKEIVERIEKEQSLINANKEIIKIFDEKIRTIIQKIWNGE